MPKLSFMFIYRYRECFNRFKRTYLYYYYIVLYVSIYVFFLNNSHKNDIRTFIIVGLSFLLLFSVAFVSLSLQIRANLYFLCARCLPQCILSLI